MSGHFFSSPKKPLLFDPVSSGSCLIHLTTCLASVCTNQCSWCPLTAFLCNELLLFIVFSSPITCLGAIKSNMQMNSHEDAWTLSFVAHIQLKQFKCAATEKVWHRLYVDIYCVRQCSFGQLNRLTSNEQYLCNSVVLMSHCQACTFKLNFRIQLVDVPTNNASAFFCSTSNCICNQ